MTEFSIDLDRDHGFSGRNLTRIMGVASALYDEIESGDEGALKRRLATLLDEFLSDGPPLPADLVDLGHEELKAVAEPIVRNIVSLLELAGGIAFALAHHLVEEGVVDDVQTGLWRIERVVRKSVLTDEEK